MLFYVFIASAGFCQNTLKKLVVVDEQGHESCLGRAGSLPECYQKVTHLQHKYFKHGFLSFSIDSVTETQSTYDVKIYKGQIYHIHQLNIEDSLGLFGHINTLKLNRLLTPNNYTALNLNIYNAYVNQGYPFIVLQHKNQILGSEVAMHIKPIAGKLYRFDSISISRNIIAPECIQQILGIEPEAIYSKKKTDRIKQLINETGYLQFDSLKIQFSPSGKVAVHIAATPLKTNSVSALVGIAPSEKSSNQITGEVKFNLINIFKQSENLSVEWQKPSKESQRLNLELGYPYIYGSGIGIIGKIDMDKQDTSYVSSTLIGGISVKASHVGQLHFYYLKAVSTLNDTTSSLFNSSRWWQYGSSFTVNKTDFSPNPSSGVYWQSDVRTGKHTSQNEKKQNNWLSGIKMKGIGFIPLQRSTLVIMNQTAMIFADSLYKNELMKFGGNDNLRGINERSLYARYYSVSSIEYRLIYEKMSNVYAFFDYGIYGTDKLYEKYTRRYAFGLGAKINSKAGQLLVLYAIGDETNKTPNPRNGLIYIGFLNRF